MKKKLFLLALLPLLVGCSKPTVVDTTEKKGPIGAFSLLGPQEGYNASGRFTFSWEEAENASYYAIEISARDDFYNDKDAVYVRESNIAQNKYDLTYPLQKKDITYYWRITATNSDYERVSSTRSFFYSSTKSDELPVQIEDVQDWTVHKDGSHADVSIDRNNFFGNDKPSLVVSFVMEDTKHEPSIPSSDGWIVITKTEDRELYGTDAFYFDCYYSGHQSNILIRVLDDDGEYWHSQLKITRNAKQTMIVKYDEFTLRTSGGNIFNQEFNWERIHYFEFVFEQTFGDGVFVVSDIKAVNYGDYEWMFMEKMNFKKTVEDYPLDTWTYENYNFIKTVSDDGSSLTLNYQSGFPGYGFQNIPINKYLAKGDAIRMKVKISDCSEGSVFYFRVTEVDVDRWQFKTPMTYFPKDEFKELVIPLKALRRPDSGSMNGDGAKQFGYILRFNCGLSDNYRAGSITIKDVEMVTLVEDIEPNFKRVVGSDGKIEDFNSYDLYTQMYYYWEQSSDNVDEAMKLDNSHRVGGYKNTYCAEFDYKADMAMATYQLYMNTESCIDKNAFQVWFKDNSVKPDDPVVAYLNDKDVAPVTTIQLTLDTGEWFRYTIDCLPKEWYSYTISFDDFVCVDASGKPIETEVKLQSNHIVHMGFGFQYFYYYNDGTGKPDKNRPYPTYAIANPVYLDEIYFVNSDSTVIEEISSTIKPDPLNPEITYIDDFESLDLEDPLTVFDNWKYASSHEANLMTPSSERFSEEVNGAKTLKMGYKGSTSVSYERATPLASSVEARGFCIDIKTDGLATIYINMNWRNGGTLMKMRRTIRPNEYNNVAGWFHCEIGWNNFTDVNDPSSATHIRLATTQYIETMSFGITNTTGAESFIYIDNLKLSSSITYSSNVISALS